MGWITMDGYPPSLSNIRYFHSSYKAELVHTKKDIILASGKTELPTFWQYKSELRDSPCILSLNFSLQIWSVNAWGKETKSGPGSLLKNTNNMRSK